MEFLEALKQFEFLQRALAGALLVSIACGLIGPFVHVRKVGYMAGGIAHAVLGGMGIAYFLGGSPFYGSLIAALLAAVVIGIVNRFNPEQEDVIIGGIWAVGMALGVIFISRTPGYNVDLMSYLFGNILLIGPQELNSTLVLDCVLAIAIFAGYQRFLAVCFDEEFAELRGVPVTFVNIVLLCMIALAVVLLIQLVGLILVIALLTLPSAIAAQYFKSLRAIMIASIVLAACFTVAGLAISYAPDLPAGPTIILLVGSTYLISSLLRSTVSKMFT